MYGQARVLCLSLMSIYVVFVIIAENEFYDADCVLSIEGPPATNNNKCRLGPLPPLPKEVSSDNQTLNMYFFWKRESGENCVFCFHLPFGDKYL